MRSLYSFSAVLGLLALSLLPSCALTSGGINTSGMETPTQDCGQQYKLANDIPELSSFVDKTTHVEIANVKRGDNLVQVGLICLTEAQTKKTRTFKVTTTGCWMNPPNGARVWQSGVRSVEVYDIGPAPKDVVKDAIPTAAPNTSCTLWEAIQRSPKLWNS